MNYKPHKAYTPCKHCKKPIEYWHDIVEVKMTATGTMTIFTQAPHYHEDCRKKLANTVKMIDNKDGSTSIYF